MNTTLYERVHMLADQQGLSDFDLSLKLGLSRNAVYSWQKSSPKTETLQKVAEFFNVSADYLLGLTDSKSSAEQKNTTTDDSLTEFFKAETEGMSEEDSKAMIAEATPKQPTLFGSEE